MKRAFSNNFCENKSHLIFSYISSRKISIRYAKKVNILGDILIPIENFKK